MGRASARRDSADGRKGEEEREWMTLRRSLLLRLEDKKPASGFGG